MQSTTVDAAIDRRDTADPEGRELGYEAPFVARVRALDPPGEARRIVDEALT